MQKNRRALRRAKVQSKAFFFESATGLVIAFCFLLFFVTPTFSQRVTVSYPLKEVMAKIEKQSCDGKFGFAVFGDTHANKTVFPFMLSLADKLDPAFIVDVGDFTNSGTNEEYSLVISQAKALKSPFLVVPGNHEYRNKYGKTSSLQIRRYKKIFGIRDYAFDYCGWRFIGMDVVAFDLMLGRQLVWLEKQLQGTHGKAAIFLHYPPGNIPKWDVHSGNYFKVNADKFTQLVQKYKVRYVFSGHYHLYDRVQLEDTTYMLVGAGGGNPDSTPSSKLNAPDAGGYYGFVYVWVSGNQSTDLLIRPNIPRLKK